MLCTRRSYRYILKTNIKSSLKLADVILNVGNNFSQILKVHISEILVFGSIFALVIIHTYGVYGGITIGDQWYSSKSRPSHDVRTFQEVVIAEGDEDILRFKSALLAGVSILSGIPLVKIVLLHCFSEYFSGICFLLFLFCMVSARQEKSSLTCGLSFFIGIRNTLGLCAVLGRIGSHSYNFLNFVDWRIHSRAIKFSNTNYPSNFMISAHPDYSTRPYLCGPAGWFCPSSACSFTFW